MIRKLLFWVQQIKFNSFTLEHKLTNVEVNSSMILHGSCMKWCGFGMILHDVAMNLYALCMHLYDAGVQLCGG